MLIGNVANNQCLTLAFYNGLINRVSSVKYFGFVLGDKLSWKNHIFYVINKCSKGIGMIKCALNFLLINQLLIIFVLFICVSLYSK